MSTVIVSENGELKTYTRGPGEKIEVTDQGVQIINDHAKKLAALGSVIRGTWIGTLLPYVVCADDITITHDDTYVYIALWGHHYRFKVEYRPNFTVENLRKLFPPHSIGTYAGMDGDWYDFNDTTSYKQSP